MIIPISCQSLFSLSAAVFLQKKKDIKYWESLDFMLILQSNFQTVMLLISFAMEKKNWTFLIKAHSQTIPLSTVYTLSKIHDSLFTTCSFNLNLNIHIPKKYM